MTTPAPDNPKQSTGYRLDELASAFDRVRDLRDWKAPIRSVIPATERRLVEKAVLWFTDTAADFEAVPGETDRLVVMAQGYRQGPAGDPTEHHSL